MKRLLFPSILLLTALLLAAWTHGNPLATGDLITDPANGNLLTDPANGNLLIR